MHPRTRAIRVLICASLIAVAALPGVAQAQKKHVPGADAFIESTPKPAPNAATQPPPPPLIDVNFYYDRYPDLQRLGRDRAALEKHWLAYGRSELRAPDRSGDPMAVSWDAWRQGCMQNRWGLLKRWGKGGTLVDPVCEFAHYQLAVAYHVMIEKPRSGNGRDHLRTGDYLKQGEYLVSANKRFFASLQPDGNFCTYDGASPAAHHGGPKWCSMGRSAGNGPYFAVQQGDGNFCVYRGNQPGDNRGGVFCVFGVSQGVQPYYYAVLQDDANFAVMRGSGPSNNWGHVWDRVTATPPKPDTGLESFWKGVKNAQKELNDWQQQQQANDAALRQSWGYPPR